MIDEIEARRAAAGVSQKVLCERAGVHPTTYSTLKTGRRAGNVSTVGKLSAALDALIAEREAA
ncbi:MAG: helix-turn-helix transcriptional regulator [Rhizobiaceae bacterium]|nr:helix-turn-helix transcriptional regulator [Rhizobiaceae bacterium]